MLLHPTITPDLINSVIVPAKKRPLGMSVTVVHKDEASLAKRHPVIDSVVSDTAFPLVMHPKEVAE